MEHSLIIQLLNVLPNAPISQPNYTAILAQRYVSHDALFISMQTLTIIYVLYRLAAKVDFLQMIQLGHVLHYAHLIQVHLESLFLRSVFKFVLKTPLPIVLQDFAPLLVILHGNSIAIIQQNPV